MPFGIDLFGSESNSETYNVTKAPTIGSQSEEGAASSLNVDGSPGANINVVQSDAEVVRNSLDAASDIARESLYTGGHIAEEGLATGESIAEQAFRGIDNILNGAAAFARDVMQEASFQTENALAAASAAGDRAAQTTQDAIDSNTVISQDAIFFADETVKNNQLFTLQALVEGLDQSGRVFDSALASSTEALTALDQSRSAETKQALESVSELAEVVQTGGESIEMKANQMMVLGALAVVGVVAYRALS